ncbi:hypothetical protein Q3C01_04625 [Bradyrhizobium sp. UFLA05-109]
MIEINAEPAAVRPSLGLVVVVTAGVYDFAGGGHQDLAGNIVRETSLRAAEN